MKYIEVESEDSNDPFTDAGGFTQFLRKCLFEADPIYEEVIEAMK